MQKSVRSMTTDGKNTPVTVTATISEGIGITVLGIPSVQVKEMLLRVSTAMMSIGFNIPGKKVVIDIRSDDGQPVTGNAASLDLAVATSILAAADICPMAQKKLDGYVIVGELGLGGEVRKVDNGCSLALHNGSTILPFDNAKSCLKQHGDWNGHKVYAAASLPDIPHILRDPEMFLISNVPFRGL